MPKRMCSVDGCDRVSKTRGWCGLHYSRWRKHGAPGGAHLLTSPIPDAMPGEASCGIEGCRRPIDSRGMCAMHYTRAKRHGEPLIERSVGAPQVPGFVSYESAHRRIVTARGRADALACVACGGAALDWSYVGGDPREMSGIRVIRGRGLAAVWSGDPAYYQPMCRPCHRRFDAAHRKAS